MIEKKNLSREMKNQIISIKFDCASKYNQNFLSVNAQYYKNRSLCLRHLGLIELKTRSTALNLKNIIYEIFDSCCIQEEQIISFTWITG